MITVDLNDLILFRIEKSCKDSMLKEAIAEVTTTNTITFRINEESDGYQQVLFDNGTLVVQCKAERFWTNVGDIANCKIELVIPSSDLPLVIKKNIRDNAPKLQQHLQKIKNATGKDFTFETNYADVLEKTLPHQSSVKERLGEILCDSYMSSIASMYVLEFLEC